MQIFRRINENRALVAVLALFAAALLFLNFISPLLYWDENTYLSNARGHIGDARYTEDFRFPFLSWMIATLWQATGESVIAAKMLVILLSVCCAYVFYLICALFLDRKTSVWAVALFCSSYLMLEWGFRVYTDIPGLLMILSGFYLIMLKQDILHYLAAGALFGAGFMTRFTYGLFIAAAAAYLIIEWASGRRIRDLNRGLAVLVGFLVVTAPWLISNKIEHKSFLWNILKQNSIVQTLGAEPWSYQALNMTKLLGPTLILLVIGIYIVVKRREKRMYAPAIFIVLHAVYATFITVNKYDRYLIPLIPFVILVAYYGMTRSRLISKWRVQISALLLVFSIAVAGFSAAELVGEGECSEDGSLQQSIGFLYENAYSSDVVISNAWPWFGYYNNLEVHSLWTDDVETYRSRYRADYIIHHDTIGPYFDNTVLDENKNLIIEKTIEGCDGTARIYSFIS